MIDWDWYEQIVKEHEEYIKNYVEPLLDLYQCTDVTKKQTSKIENDLASIFQTQNASDKKSTKSK